MKKLLHYPEMVLLIILAVTVFFALQIPSLVINNDLEIFIPEEHPSKQSYKSMQDTFGSQSIIGVGVEFSAGSVFEADRISLISELTSKIEGLDYVDSISSLTSADYIEGTSEGMRATSLVEDFSGSSREVRKLKSRIIEWEEMYRQNLVSDDFSSTQIAVTLVKGAETEERTAFYRQLQETLAHYQRPDASFYVAGDPVAMVLMNKNITGDLTYLIPLVTLVVILVLFLAFRNIGGVLLPMLTVIISTVWALGIMSLLDIYFSMISTVVPVILIAVGSAYVIHVFNHYYDSVRNSGTEISRKTHSEIVYTTMREIGPPVVMTALTTAAGFASIATSTIVPMRHFGIVNAIGVVSALVLTLTFVPAVLLLRHGALKQTNSQHSRFDYDARFNRILENFYHFFSKRRIRIIVLSILIIGVSLYGISQIVVENAMMEYFQYDSEIRRSDRFLQNKFSGSKVFSIIVEGEEKGALTDPEVLEGMDKLKRYLMDEHEEIGTILSFSDFVKRMNQVMNYPSVEMMEDDGDLPVFRQVLDDSSGVPGSVSEKSSASDGGTFGAETSETSGSADVEGSFFSDDNETNGEAPSGGADVEGSFFSDSSANSSSSPDSGSKAAEGAESSGGTSTQSVKTAAAQSEESAASQPGSVSSGRNFGYSTSVSYQRLIETFNKAYYSAESMDMSVHEFMNQVNRQLNFKGEYYNEIPVDPSKYPVSSKEELSNLISQYLLVYSGSLDDFADDSLEPSRARMTVQLRSTNTRAIEDIREDILRFAGEYFPEGYTVSIAGYADMERAVTKLIVRSQILSLLSAFLVVFLIVALANRSAVAGIYGIVPLSFAVLINFGLMGIAGIDLDIATAMIASIAIGIGVDYTIHFLARYRIEWNATGNADEATKRTILTTGRAIVFNAFSVAAGFAVLLFSNFNPLRYVGLLVAIIMITSSLSAMTILPVLLNIFQPKFLDYRKKEEK